MTTDTKWFIRGIAWATARIIQDYDEPSMAIELLKSSGYNRHDLLEAGVDNQDMMVLRPHLRRIGSRGIRELK
jgi:hypothetical protein